MKRLFTLLALLCAVVAASAPAAARAATCTPPKYPGSGYFTSLKVSHVSCSTGKSVALAFHKCRVKKGVKGRCTSRVKGYSCHETRESIPSEIDGRVTCKRGSRKVSLTYQQNT
jgi:hypothetical protein